MSFNLSWLERELDLVELAVYGNVKSVEGRQCDCKNMEEWKESVKQFQQSVKKGKSYATS